MINNVGVGMRYPGVFFSRNDVAIVEAAAGSCDAAPFITFQYLKTHVCRWGRSRSGLQRLR